VSGPIGSGNTSFCIRFVQNVDYLCTEQKFGGGIVWCYGEKTAVPPRQHLPANISFNESVLDEVGNVLVERCLVILDYLLNDVYSKQVCELFTRACHHRNISVIRITENLFDEGRFCRDISLNAHYIVALKKSGIRSSSCLWPNKCILNIESVCITHNWMRPKNPTATSSWFCHKID